MGLKDFPDNEMVDGFFVTVVGPWLQGSVMCSGIWLQVGEL